MKPRKGLKVIRSIWSFPVSSGLLSSLRHHRTNRGGAKFYVEHSNDVGISDDWLFSAFVSETYRN